MLAKCSLRKFSTNEIIDELNVPTSFVEIISMHHEAKAIMLMVGQSKVAKDNM